MLSIKQSSSELRMSKTFTVKKRPADPPWDPTPQTPIAVNKAGKVSVPAKPMIKPNFTKASIALGKMAPKAAKLALKPAAKLAGVKPKPPKVVSVIETPKMPNHMRLKILNLASQHEVYREDTPKKTATIPALSASTAAEALGTSAITLAKWVNKGMIPAPILKRVDTPIGNFYHVDEVLAMAQLFLEHRESFRYYREDHTDLRKRLSADVAKVRAGMFA